MMDLVANKFIYLIIVNIIWVIMGMFMEIRKEIQYNCPARMQYDAFSPPPGAKASLMQPPLPRAEL